MMRCTIWCHLYNFKNMKNTHEGVLISVKLQADDRTTHHKWVECIPLFSTGNILPCDQINFSALFSGSAVNFRYFS